MAVEVKHLYLVSAELNAAGKVRAGTARPISNTFITLENQATVIYDKGNAPEEYQSQIINKSRQLYLTDSIGSIGNFVNGKFSDDAKQALTDTFEVRTNIEILDKAEVYFPPAHLIHYSFAAHGYQNWLSELQKHIGNIISASNQVKATFELKPYLLDVSSDFQDPDSINSVDYKRWYKKHSGAKVRVLCLPRARAFMVKFSDQRYERARVEILNRKGKSAFYADPERKKTIAVVQKIIDIDRSTLGYGAVFYDLDNHYDSNAQSEDQMYQFTIKPDALNINLNNEGNTYKLVERLRFPIKTLAGEFDVINGDAFSLEECLVRQFPHRYPHIIKNITQQQKSPDVFQGADSLLHAFNTNQDKLKLVGGAYAAGSTASFLRTVGMGIYNGIEEKNEGLRLLRGSINLAFNIYDLNKQTIEALEYIVENYTPGASGVVQPISRARALASLAGGVDPESLWAEAVVDSVDEVVNDMSEVTLPKKLKKVFKTSQAIVEGMGKGLDVYSVFNDAQGVMVSYNNMQDAITNNQAIMDSYAHKVYFKDAVDDVSGSLSRVEIADGQKALQAFQSKHQKTMQVSQVGDLKFINVTFAFDRSGFAKDDSFDEFSNFLQSLSVPYDLVLAGHTCSIGSPSYNLELSKRRALSVKKILLDAGVGDCSDVDITIQAFGATKPVASNANEENRKKNRRVDAVVVLKKISRFKPSREGIESVEKHRALSSLHTAEMGDSLSKLVVSTLDLIAGTPPTNIYHLGFSLLWAAGGVLSDGANLLNDAVFGEAFLGTVKDFNQHDRLSAANQALLLERTKFRKNISAGYYLETQARLRAEALNGLMQLLIRCSVETDDVLNRLKFDIDNIQDSRDSFGYADNLEFYQVKRYVEEFILSDGWKIFSGALHPVALDEYWLYLIKTNRLEQKVNQGNDLSWQEKAIELANDYAKEAGSYADLVKDNIIDAASDLVLSGRYIKNNLASLFHAERDYLTTARFKEFFPIHYVQSDEMEEMFAAVKPDFSNLDCDVYLGMMHSVKESGNDSDQWLSMSKWLETKRSWVSPLDEIRVCILLNPDNDIVSDYIENGSISYIPYKVMPTRVDGLNMSGPANDGFIQKLKYDDLTVDEKRLLGDHDKEDIEGKLYGAIVYPYFKLGKKIIHGTKPLANAASAWLNVTDEHALSSVFNWDHRWDMVYKYEVMLGYNTATLDNVRYSKKVSSGRMKGTYQRYEFPYAIWDGEHTESPYKGESVLLDRHFLQVGNEEKETLPPLFVNPEVFCMLDVNSQSKGRYEYPDNNWYSGNKIPNGLKWESNKLGIPSFSWQDPVEVLILVVCDSVDEAAYNKRLLETDSIPAQIQLLRNGHNLHEKVGDGDIFTMINGPKYDTALRPLGNLIKNETDGVKFEWSEVAGEEDYSQLYEHLSEPMALQMLSGFKAKVKAEDESLLESIKDAIADEWDEITDGAERKPVYCARVMLNYQSVLGHIENGIKPFAVNPFDDFNQDGDYEDDQGWKLRVQVTSAGDSGLKEAVAHGEYVLPYPKGLNDKKSHWYHVEEGVLKETKNIIESDKQQAKKYKDKTVLERPPSHPVSPLMKWIVDGESGNDFSEKQKESISNWLLKQGSRKTLSMAELEVLK